MRTAEFYTWRNIFRGARTKPDLHGALRHAAYAGAWKRFEPLWDMAIRAIRVAALRGLGTIRVGSSGVLA